MSRARRRLLVAVAALGVALLLGGTALVVADAHARAAAAERVVDELVDFYAAEEGYEVAARGPILRSILADSVSYDGPLPSLYTESSQDYVTARYGAFGRVFSFVPLDRPWTPRLIVTPLVAGAILLGASVLVAASASSPRTRVADGRS